jgi:hypothetical protein
LVPISVTRSQLDTLVGADVTQAAIADEGQWIDVDPLRPMPPALAFLILARLQRLLVAVEMDLEVHPAELGDIAAAMGAGFDTMIPRVREVAHA